MQFTALSPTASGSPFVHLRQNVQRFFVEFSVALPPPGCMIANPPLVKQPAPHLPDSSAIYGHDHIGVPRKCVAQVDPGRTA